MATQIDATLSLNRFEEDLVVMPEYRGNDIRSVDHDEMRFSANFAYDWIPSSARHPSAILHSTLTISERPFDKPDTVEEDTSCVHFRGVKRSDGVVEVVVDGLPRGTIAIRDDLEPDWTNERESIYFRLELEYDEEESVRRYGEGRIRKQRRRFESELETV